MRYGGGPVQTGACWSESHARAMPALVTHAWSGSELQQLHRLGGCPYALVLGKLECVVDGGIVQLGLVRFVGIQSTHGTNPGLDWVDPVPSPNPCQTNPC
jgi:hypothetical protein